MNYTRTETYIELRWKMIVQDPDCVKAMEFFVDDVKAKDIWGSHNENVRIDKIGTFSLKIQVFFLKSGTSGNCYGSNRKCRCFEATTHLNVHKGNHDDNDYDNKGDGSDTNNVNAEESTHCDLALGGAFGGGECFISSVRSSSGYHGLIEIRSSSSANPLFQIFQILQIRK